MIKGQSWIKSLKEAVKKVLDLDCYYIRKVDFGVRDFGDFLGVFVD